MYKILIVEDDEVIGRTVQNHLREWGYEAACVKDLKHVLAEFAAFEPHLVLMDILLPYFNGCYLSLIHISQCHNNTFLCHISYLSVRCNLIKKV